ncbi:hypothetical protein CCMSSC00406_0003341 [Pleurotus cornucopiae]|uniref:Uncharacterized protein n=1 Tax=Pleurotus cornucopiae TaxID=5321 RepID=A0ACB7JCG3_PLECO|nr:hypothetical protein CCMSSC00406_0003341 [Pleurotus cornucopiae]
MKNSIVFMLFSAVALSGASQSVAERSSSDSEPNLEARKAADYAPAAGMAAKILGQALNLPSAQNGPPTMGMGYGMGMGMGMGTGYYRRDVVEDLLGRELSDHEAGVMDYLRARDNEYEELEARKAADYAPAAGMAAKILGQALNLPSAQNGPPTMGMGYGMGMGMGMGMGYYRRDFEELLGRELSDDEASVLEGLQARDGEELEARDGAYYASGQGEDLFERELLEMFGDSFI